MLARSNPNQRELRSRSVLIAVALSLIAALGAIPAATATAGDRPSLRPDGPPLVDGMRVLSGSLHDHSTDSDGDTSSPDVARWLFDHRDELGIDLFALTDHSDGFPVALGSPGDLDPWTRQGLVADQFSHDGFTTLRGFELTNDQENHINVIDSENWTNRWTTGEASMRMEPFWEWLSTPPVTDPSGRGLGFGGGDGIGQFNHPDGKGALNWDDYAYHAGAAERMSLIEIRGSQARDGINSSDAGWYWFALSQGWTVSPVMNWDWHDWAGDGVITNETPGAYCGIIGFLPCQRSQVVAPSSTADAVVDALRNSRTTASQRPNLWATLRGPGGEWQGSSVLASPGETIRLEVDAGSGTDELTRVDIVGDAGVSPYPYYYGSNVHCDTSGCDPTGFSHSQMTPSYIEQQRRYLASDGHATRKARIDAPPPGTVMATAPLEGHRDHVFIEVKVPNTPSTRPDGKHFFYAIVYAGAPRAWTGPILSSPSS